MPLMKLEDQPVLTPVEGYRARMVHSESMTLAYWEVDAGAALPEHSHPHEQVASVIEGEFELTVGDEAHTLRPGDVVVIPPDVLHSGRAVTDCRLIDAFHPVREDYK